MKEIKNSIKRARLWRQQLNENNITNLNHTEWCINTGLWETLGWVNDSSRYNIFGWYVTGKDGSEV